MSDPTPQRLRSAARTVAVQLLYAFEQNKYVDDGQLLTDDAEAAAVPLAETILRGFAEQRVPVDAAIDKRLENWTIHRLAVVDRAILRLGAYEILYCSDVPPKVAINEAIELAKKFGSEEKTAKLVNGVLDRIARDHRANELTGSIRKPAPAPAP